MTLSSKRRLAVSLAVATLVPGAVLVWLGVRVLQEDTASARQRQREQLEIAAGRLALDIERRLANREEQLARGEGLRLTPLGVEAGRGDVAPLLFQPVSTLEALPRDPALADAERQEFQQHDRVAAAATYRRLSATAAPETRAAALVGLARVLRQAGEPERALDAYAQLRDLGPVLVGHQPAVLIALQGRCKVFEETSKSRELQLAADDLGRAVGRGALPIDRATFDLYRDLVRDWHGPAPSEDAVIRTEAANRMWHAWRSGELPSHGRRVVRTESGPALAVWGQYDDAIRLWVESARDAERLIAPSPDEPRLRVGIFDLDGTRLSGAPSPGVGALTLSPAETRLPFVVMAAWSSGATGDEASRRTFIVAGLVSTLALMVLAAYSLYRSIARELTLARQQSDFVSAVSHEFRTPLTSMRHLTDLLVSRTIPSEDRRSQYYELLSHETERLHQLVETLLSFGRIEAGSYAFRMAAIDVSQMVRGLVEDFRRDLASGRDVVCDVEEGLAPVHGDRDTLVRALWNLMENAVKYSSPGSRIRVFARRSDGGVALGVSDEGMGIPPGETSRIFQKFVRGSGARQAGIRGVGIGLALVKRIVDAHGGSIRVESEVGRGSTFTMVVPA